MLIETILAKYNQYLIESRLDFISEKYKNKIPQETINDYHDSIPDKGHLEWVLKQHLNNNISSKQDLVNTLTHFTKVKSQLPNKDINSYKTPDELKQTISQYSPKEDKSKNIQTVYEDNTGLSIKFAKTHEGAKELAKLPSNNIHRIPKATWCNAADSNNGKDMFDTYRNIGSHAYVIHDNSSKYQIHINHADEIEARDEVNEPISQELAKSYIDKVHHNTTINNDEDYKSALKSDKIFFHSQINPDYEKHGTDDESLIYGHYKRFNKLISKESHPTYKIQQIIHSGNRPAGTLLLSKRPSSPELEKHLIENPNDKLINHMVYNHIIHKNQIAFSNDTAKVLLNRFKSDRIATRLVFKNGTDTDYDLTKHAFENNIFSKEYIGRIYSEHGNRIPEDIKEAASKYGDYKDTIYNALKKDAGPFEEMHNHIRIFGHSKEGGDYFVKKYLNDPDIEGSKEEKYKKLYDVVTNHYNKAHNIIPAMLDNYPENANHSKFTKLIRHTSETDNQNQDTHAYNKDAKNRLTDKYIDLIKHDKEAVKSVLSDHLGYLSLHENEINKLYDAGHFSDEEVPEAFMDYSTPKILDHVVSSNILKLHHMLKYYMQHHDYIHKALDHVIPNYNPSNQDHLGTIDTAISIARNWEGDSGKTLPRLLHPNNSHALLQQVIPEFNRNLYPSAYDKLESSPKANLIDRYSHY